MVSRAGAAALLLLSGLVSGCFEDRMRPGPLESETEVRLSVQLLAPRSGLTVETESDIAVQVLGRDLAGRSLVGVGYVVRRMTGGTPALDSGAVRFAGRADTLHTFSFRLPGTLATNTPVSVFGIAYGTGARTSLSEPSPLVVVQCNVGVCR